MAHLSAQDTAGHRAEAWSCCGPLRQPVVEVTGRPPLCPPPWGHRTTAVRTPGVAPTWPRRQLQTLSELLRVTSGSFQKLLEEQESSFSQYILRIRCHLLGRAFSPPSHLSPPGLLPDFYDKLYSPPSPPSGRVPQPLTQRSAYTSSGAPMAAPSSPCGPKCPGSAINTQDMKRGMVNKNVSQGVKQSRGGFFPSLLPGSLEFV